MISRMVSRSGLVVLHLDVAKAAALLDHSTLVCIHCTDVQEVILLPYFGPFALFSQATC